MGGPLRGRLMVGRLTLDQVVKVRILAPQPHESPLPTRVFASLDRRWRQGRNPLATLRFPRRLTMLAGLALAVSRAEPNRERLAPALRAGANLLLSLLDPRVGSACAGSLACVPRRPLVMRSLNEEVDLTLFRVHVIQSVEGADRAGVCGCPGAFAGTGKSNARSSRRARYLASKSGASTQTRDNGCADRSRERLPHYVPPCLDAPVASAAKEQPNLAD
jgi:hypothetical protein